MTCTTTSTCDAALLAAVATELHDITDEKQLYRRILDHGVGLVADADAASLSVRGRRGTTTLAATSPAAERAETLQQSLGEGPALEMSGGGAWLRSGDLAGEERWPAWAASVTASGLRSALALGLAHRGEVIGALHLYAVRPGRFQDSHRLAVARLYAGHVAHALGGLRRVGDLQAAIASRHAIGLAQGILMERYGVGPESAFAFLRRMSSTHNRKLRDVAAELVASGAAGGEGPLR